MGKPDDDLVVAFPGLVVWILAGLSWLLVIGLVQLLEWLGVF